MAKKDIGFVNPFDTGVNYDDFLASIPKDMTIEKYCEGNLDAEQIAWLVEDLKHYNKK